MTTSATAGRATGSLAIPCLIVFFSGFCIMVIELVASRLVSGYIGMSLYTWTSVIGVILAGISVGNYIGGRLADRFESKRLVACLFLLSAAASLSILWLTHWIGTATMDWVGTQNLWTARVLCVVFGAFLLPGTALGTISPGIAKWALDYGYATGPTVGTIYAWNTIGSIAGTFVTGFWLLSWFNVSTIVYLVSGALALAAVAFLPAILFSRDVQTPVCRVVVEREERGGLAVPIFLVFVSGFVVMAVELAASRLVAGHIGQSVYTWTSVIGVILAGISMGNYIGGQLSDSFESKPLVAGLFLLSSILCLLILPTQHIVDNADESWMGATQWWLRVLSVVFAAYFLPATALGTISPAVAKWALDQGYATGRTVGTIYAWNVIGSICGTFATGFYLISALYVSRLLALCGLLLAAIAVAFTFRSPFWLQKLAASCWAVVCVGVTILAALPPARFETAVLTMFPVSVTSLDQQQASFLNQAIQRLDDQWSEPPIDEPELARAITELRRLALKIRETLNVNESTSKYPVGAELNNDLHQLRGWAESIESQMKRTFVQGPIRRAVNDIRRRTYDIFGTAERKRLLSFAKWLSRDEEVNVWDQYLEHLTYYDESDYYTIQVSEDTVTSNLQNDYAVDEDGEVLKDETGDPVPREHTIRQLVLDALIHGYVDLSDLSYLHYEYEHIYASVSHRLLRAHRMQGQDLKVLFLGGGSYTFPRYLTHYYPEIHCDVAEIDRRVTEAVQKSMGLNAACGKSFIIADSVQPADDNLLVPKPKFASIFSIARPGPAGPAERFKYYETKLKLAGAQLVENAEFDKEDVDYVLDIRTDANASSPIVDRAKELNIPTISTQQLEEMLAETSHPNIQTHIGDARQYIMRNTGDGEYDVIYGDAFNDFSVPAHLTTLEFNRDMARLLKPDGVFMANVIDIWSVSEFMGAYANTLKEVFKHVYLLSTSEEPGDSRSTFVIICSQVPLELHDLGQREEDVKGLASYLMEGALLHSVDRGGRVPVPTKSFVSDGQTTSFYTGAADVEIEISRQLTEDDYELQTAEIVRLSEPLEENRELVLDLVFQNEPFSIVVREQNKTYFLQEPEIRTKSSDLNFSVDGNTAITFLNLKPGTTVRGSVQPETVTVSLTGDGKSDSIKIPERKVRLEMERILDEGDYTLKDGVVQLHQALPKGTQVTIRGWSNEKIILTDDYCPVDNFLAKVAATRAD